MRLSAHCGPANPDNLGGRPFIPGSVRLQSEASLLEDGRELLEFRGVEIGDSAENHAGALRSAALGPAIPEPTAPHSPSTVDLPWASHRGGSTGAFQRRSDVRQSL